MIVSDRARFVFIHNPKCAGTSLRNALKPWDDRKNFYWMFDDRSPLGRKLDLAHLPLEDMRSYPDFGLLADYFVFTVVRHPLDRAMSAWGEFVTKGHTAFPADGPDDFTLRYLTPERLRSDHRFIHFCPQHYFTHIGPKGHADWIARFERLSADLARLPSLIGVPVEVRHANRRGEPLPKFGPEAQAKLRELYARDFALFGYE